MHWLESITGLIPLQLQISLKKSTTANKYTPERETLLCGSWLIAKVPFYKLQDLFFCSGTFCMCCPKLPVASIQEKWCYTDIWNLSDRNRGKDEWASWRCCCLCEHCRWFMDSQPPTLSLCCCDSQDKQWLQEPFSPSFLSLAKKKKLDLLGSGDVVEKCLRVLLLLLFLERGLLL